MIEDESVREGAQRPGDPLATVLATHSGISTVDTRAYLREQTRLARLQSENLIEQNAFEISHLKWRRVADRMRGIGYFIVVVLAFLMFALIGAMIWSARNDHSLVIESFSVPPVLAERGESGAVVAQHVLDRIVAMQSGTQSLRAANTYRNDWGDELKVQIPDTGVSLTEAYRILAGRLGRQTRVTGEVVRGESGFIVTARAGAGAGAEFRGTNLDALLDQAAEHLFGETQPYRYGIYLSSHGRDTDAKAVLMALAQGDAPIGERAWAYSGLLFVEDDTRRSEQYGFAAVALNPRLLLAHNNLSAVAWRLGHSEFNYREAATGLKLLDEDAGVELDHRVLGNMHSVLAEEADAALGDYANATREMRLDVAIEYSGLKARSQAYLVRDLALMHDDEAAKHIAIDPLLFQSISTANRQILLTSFVHGLLDIETDSLGAAKAELSKGIESLGPRYVSVQLQAPLAFVLSKLGDVEPARALAAKLPPDCYPCVISRARIEAAAGNWQFAQKLFADGVRLGPSLPLADTAWGAALLARGQYDAALARFDHAHAKGPHFADPLEMWGEALMQMNRSDLALVKFEEANKYAPNWGRLHFEWGKALFHAGRRDDAKKQIASASTLDLSPSDKAAIGRWIRLHG
jgi:tetratricopeptide (TPR) repeat protein